MAMKLELSLIVLGVLQLLPQAHAEEAASVPPAAPLSAEARDVLKQLDAEAEGYAEVAQQIWKLAEVGYQEAKSSALLQQRLRDAGFTVRAGVAGIPTSFVASYGSGKPVVALLAEFDALPGLSQAAQPTRKLLVEGGPGCGHNLFGTASVAAGIAVKNWLASGKRPGTVRVYGTPAEEGGSGKVYMLRAGLFEGVQGVVQWHPGDRNVVWSESTLANIGAKFRFRGIAAHAASAPYKGRSALDGVEAMNHMVNMMREHLPQETRIHYVITSGGKAPNVVPDFAEVYYYARHPEMKALDEIWERVVAASKGAALGTGTTVDQEITGAVWNVLPSSTLDGIQKANLARVGGVVYTPAERAFAEQIRTSLPQPLIPLGKEAGIWDAKEDGGREGMGSTDVGDVSWHIPTAQLVTATFVPGTPAHSWQAVAAAGTGIGAKGMMVAAKTMALTTIDLLSDPGQLARAEEELVRRRGPRFVYKTRLADRKPALDYRK
jgi:aminobenzoyl-glutamate utilization protein B